MTLAGRQSQYKRSEEKKNLLPLPEFETRTLSLVTSSLYRMNPGFHYCGMEPRNALTQKVGQQAAAGNSSAALTFREFSMSPRNMFNTSPTAYVPLHSNTSLLAPVHLCMILVAVLAEGYCQCVRCTTYHTGASANQ